MPTNQQMLYNYEQILLVEREEIGGKEFGRVVKHFREKLHMTRAEFAEAAGIHVSFVNGIERGAQTPSKETAILMFNVLWCANEFGPEVTWVDHSELNPDELFDLLVQIPGGKNFAFLFTSEVQGQNKRSIPEQSNKRPVFVAMRMAVSEGEKAALLGVYKERVLAEARCWRDRNSMQQTEVIECILNTDIEVN